ncbi:MAG: hypothetical protein GF421_12630 [Candidatus Aminicenantes bacterium]|nr:hypothetical protein [Candidatus Aminicenantes bacterium]
MKAFGPIILILMIPCVIFSQDIDSGVTVPPAGRASLAFSYQDLSRTFKFDGLKEKVERDILKATFKYSPSQYVNLYAFVGTSDFPNSFFSTENNIYYGGGVKYTLTGTVDIEEENGKHINIKGSTGFDLQIARLQPLNNSDPSDFSLTKLQGAVDFGVRLFRFAGYIGFKTNKLLGKAVLPLDEEMDIKSRGFFSMFLGFDYDFSHTLALTSEFSFFSDSSWALGLRIDL